MYFVPDKAIGGNKVLMHLLQKRTFIVVRTDV